MDDNRKSGEGVEARVLVEHALNVARTLNTSSLLVQVGDGRDVRLFESRRQQERIIWLVPQGREFPGPRESQDVQLAMPAIDLTRMSPIGIGLFLAVLHGHVALDETVVCLSGGVGGKRLDTMVITNPRRDFPWLGDRRLAESFPQVVSHELARLLDIALRFANEGREGKPIGTIFVLGDPAELEPHLNQMILNPLAGHGQKRRNIHNPAMLETLRELSALDGAFVIDRKGVVRSAGTYLQAPSSRLQIADGLGTRHRAAAAITAATTATAIVISESSGTVTVFHGGRGILTLERP